jgi:hypothetical protein
MPGFLSRGSVRVVLGLLVSAVFVFATLSRVDLALVGEALGRVQPAGLVIAVGLVAIETALRALRWHLLLQPVRPTKYRSVVAYLCIGYLANAILPARLGDLTRAYLAGGAFGIARIGVLGTILVERLSDGLFILAAVAVLGVVVAGGGSLATTAAMLGAIVLAGVVGLVVLFLVARRVGVHETRTGRIVSDLLARLGVGAVALRRPAALVAVIGLTVLPFAVGVATFGVVARAVGIDLTVTQLALAFGAVSLSFAIPAAPGSVGTYEFVGVTVLTAYGVTAEIALATILLVHVLVTLSTSLAGLAAAWLLHFRVGTVTHSAAAAGAVAPVEADGR